MQPSEPRTVVTLVVLDEDHPWRDQVLALAPASRQEVYSGRAAQTLPEADADPKRTPFAVAADGAPVGFGVLDRVGILADLVDEPSRAVLLRAFYVDAAHQGRGLGTAAARALAPLTAAIYDDVELVVLTANLENPAAVTAYLRAGFVDTGTRYLGGAAGPQHVLVMAVPRPARRRRAATPTS